MGWSSLHIQWLIGESYEYLWRSPNECVLSEHVCYIQAVFTLTFQGIPLGPVHQGVEQGHKGTQCAASVNPPEQAVVSGKLLKSASYLIRAVVTACGTGRSSIISLSQLQLFSYYLPQGQCLFR